MMMTIPQEVIEAAENSHRHFYPKGPFVSVTLAQWALESAWGKRMSGKNNPFGIQANAAQKAAGEYTLCHTWEENSDGVHMPRVEAFADYPTLEAAFDAHAALLTHPHYADCMAAETPYAYCIALKKDGYATAVNYPEALWTIIRTADLTQYD
jgi:flagellum-specific peptidoglycan hydrolase FlgJ